MDVIASYYTNESRIMPVKDYPVSSRHRLRLEIDISFTIDVESCRDLVDKIDEQRCEIADAQQRDIR